MSRKKKAVRREAPNDSVLVVPPLDAEPWPTLGDQVHAFIEAYLVHGPGDLNGKPARVDDEKRALLYRAYEIFPRCPGGSVRTGMRPGEFGAWTCKLHNACPTGRRRFNRAGFSLIKGSAKTEFAAWISAAELDREGPVRFDGFDAHGQPVGRPVVDPYIPMVAYTEEQSEDLAYGALYSILEHSKIVDHFDLGLKRIMRIKGDGEAKPLASAPNARDGAKTTFQHFDETHRMTLKRLRDAHTTMLANMPKRAIADAWSLETTTAPSPGDGSVAEATMEYAHAVRDGRVKDSKLFFFHRQASDVHDLKTPESRRAAFIEAAGPLIDRYDIATVIAQWDDPNADVSYLERAWLNRPRQSSQKAFDVVRFRELAKPELELEDGELITLGFDGARYHDSVALMATGIRTGHQAVLGKWEKPYELEKQGKPWEAPELEVSEAVAAAFERWNVWRMYADPPYWESTVADWSGKYGKERVIRWYTNRWAKMAYAVRAYAQAITDGHLSYDGDEAFARHIGNAYRYLLHVRDDKGIRMYAIQKERPDSPNKIDIGMAGILSWQARTDALTEGMGQPPGGEWDGEVVALA